MFRLDRTDGRQRGILLPEKMADQEILAKRLLRRTAALQCELNGDVDRLRVVGMSAESGQKPNSALLERNVLFLYVLEKHQTQELPAFWDCLRASVKQVFQDAFPESFTGPSQLGGVSFHLRVGHSASESIISRRTALGNTLPQRKLIDGDVSLRKENKVALFNYYPPDYGLFNAQKNQPVPALHGDFPSLNALQLAWQAGSEQALLLGIVENDILSFLATTPGTEMLRPQVREE